jgi:hypothetical protein
VSLAFLGQAGREGTYIYKKWNKEKIKKSSINDEAEFKER